MKKAPSDVATDLTVITDPDDGTVYDLLGPNAATTGTDIGDFVVTWVKGPGADELTITIIQADTIGASALAAMAAEGKTSKVVDGVTWG